LLLTVILPLSLLQTGFPYALSQKKLFVATTMAAEAKILRLVFTYFYAAFLTQERLSAR
jgi:hypothetical protein